MFLHSAAVVGALYCRKAPNMSLPLDNQIALVTGASRGIGRAIATRIAADGAHVIAHYARSRNAADALVSEIADGGGTAEAVAADLATPQGVETLVDAVRDRLGDRRLDILINNAGVAEYTGFGDTDAAAMDRQYAINVRAPFLLTARLLDRLSDDGRIVFTSSIVAKTYFAGIPAYALTKGAIDTLVRHLAAELGARGIRVNAVAPGAIETDMSDWLRSDDGEATAKAFQALQRVGQPDDIAGVVSFLAGPDSNWVTGQVIDASGGSKL